MCLADVYQDAQPLPGLVLLADEIGFQDVLAFGGDLNSRGESGHAVICRIGVWDCAPGQRSVQVTERLYCRVLQGRLRIADGLGRHWDLSSGSACLLLPGFSGLIEVSVHCQVGYVLFDFPCGGALRWCMSVKGCTEPERIGFGG